MNASPTALAAVFYAGATLASLERCRLLDPLERRLLIAHATGLNRIELITRAERPLSEAEAAALRTLFERRLAGEPIAYLLGSREFFGLPLRVTPAVLIPRPDTELLVELALARMAPGARVLDLGTGSGAIALAIAHSRPDAAVTALDVSPAALTLARENASALQLANVSFIESSWYDALDPGAQPFDLIVSNPPYIVQGDPHLTQGDLRFEPLDALTDHGDGLGALRHIVEGAPRYLRADGWLLMEHGYDQAGAVRALLAPPWHDAQSWRDLAGIERAGGAQYRGGFSRQG